jgi:hypothetical protein
MLLCFKIYKIIIKYKNLIFNLKVKIILYIITIII